MCGLARQRRAGLDGIDDQRPWATCHVRGESSRTPSRPRAEVSSREVQDFDQSSQRGPICRPDGWQLAIEMSNTDRSELASQCQWPREAVRDHNWRFWFGLVRRC